MSKKEKRQNSKVIQHDLVKEVFVRYRGLSLVSSRNFVTTFYYINLQKFKSYKPIKLQKEMNLKIQM